MLLSADNLCKQLGSRQGPTECRPWSRSKPLIAHSDSVGERKEILGKVNFVKLKHEKLPIMQGYDILNTCTFEKDLCGVPV